LYALRQDKHLIEEVQRGQIKIDSLSKKLILKYAGVDAINEAFLPLFIRKIHHDELILAVTKAINYQQNQMVDRDNLDLEINKILRLAANDNFTAFYH
jgi:hypothetical protein